jgi:alkylation response protein AidB-like acyl-CoA dehydrogenase
MTDDVIATAIALAPRIRAAREESEAARRVPPDLADALAAAGLLQMYLPRSMGGPELPPLTVFHAIEEVSKADGPVGGCTMIATAASLFPGWLHADVGRAMCGQPADLRGAGSREARAPASRARRAWGGPVASRCRAAAAPVERIACCSTNACRRRRAACSARRVPSRARLGAAHSNYPARWAGNIST